MTDLLLAGGMALLLAMLGTPLLINWLRAQGIGQQIREDGPQRHLTKAGTPTMGGVAIIGAAVVGYLFEHIEGTFTTRGLVAVLAVCALGWAGNDRRLDQGAPAAEPRPQQAGQGWPASSSSPSPSPWYASPG